MTTSRSLSKLVSEGMLTPLRSFFNRTSSSSMSTAQHVTIVSSVTHRSLMKNIHWTTLTEQGHTIPLLLQILNNQNLFITTTPHPTTTSLVSCKFSTMSIPLLPQHFKYGVITTPLLPQLTSNMNFMLNSVGNRNQSVLMHHQTNKHVQLLQRWIHIAVHSSTFQCFIECSREDCIFIQPSLTHFHVSC